MAAVTLANCSVHKDLEGSYCTTMIISPNTMDSNDTIDVSDLIQDGQLLLVTAWDVESGDAATCTYATGTGVLTIDAAGGTINHTYAIEVRHVGYTFTP